MKNTILASVLGGVVLFAWGFLSWAILPWHNAVANKFTDEAAVVQILEQNAPSAGIYYLPFEEEDYKAGQMAGFANILPNGYSGNMPAMMGIGLIGSMLSALIVLLLLNHTSGLSYWKKVGFVTLTGFAIGAISHFPYWNWFGFSNAYIGVMILDTVIAWYLAGFVLAKFSKETY